MKTTMKTSMKILSLVTLLLSFNAAAKVVVVSDIDDTIKKANSASSGIGEIYHFLRKKIYPEMRDLFVELDQAYRAEGEDVEFYYVSAAPDIVFNQEKWLCKHGFPQGPATLRRLGDGGTYEYKKRVIGNILKDLGPEDTVYLFGDNASKDAIVYSELVSELGLNGYIYIRDVQTDATYWNADFDVNRIRSVRYYFSERDLLRDRGLYFMSAELRDTIEASYEEKSLIPEYTLKTLKKRIRKAWDCGWKKSCRREAKELAKTFWNNYYSTY